MFPTSASSKLKLNGSPVTGIVTSRGISSTITNGTSTLTNLPPHCYGSASAAAAIISPAASLDLLMLGDSRQYAIGPYLTANCVGVPFSGAATATDFYGQSWRSAAVFSPISTPHLPVACGFGNVGDLTPLNVVVHTLAASTSGANDQYAQYDYRQYTASTYDIARLQGSVVRVYFWLLQGPTGITTDDVQVVIDTAGGGIFRSAYFNTYAATQGYKLVYMDLPNTHNWTTYPSIYPKLVHRYNTTTVAGQTLVVLGCYVKSLAVGVSFIPAAIGSRYTVDYVTTGVFGTSIFSSFLPAISANPAMWIDLGTNGSGANSDVADKVTICQRLRAQYPNAPILFTTAYPGGTESRFYNPGWRRGSLEVLASIGNCLVIDTYRAQPVAPAAISGAGLTGVYYTGGDLVHYNATGMADFSYTLGSLLSECAALA